ncbi:DUF1294 domain-containing protein [Stratiformator vulcanicus]|uniref:DUF1294 domain-containing protein n=1 Tax=Stratiformator vulcanicus TaxID=2527980 RepID=A0A517R301_9PLAN|nr:DUF1294 domain-containing protein [Stratiformator vulcanicus]QDT38258.1 hypothetical protein Pan189_26480 [Stratiformator vulcanicus]
MNVFRPLGIRGWLAVAAGFFITLCLLALWVDIGSSGINLWWTTRGYFALTVLMSAIAFPLIGWDKMLAKGGRRRVPESTLHLVELLGGWPGSLIGQQVFRHKTLKTGYRVVFGMIAAVHVAIVLFIFWNWIWHGEESVANTSAAAVSGRSSIVLTLEDQSDEQFTTPQDRRSG